MSCQCTFLIDDDGNFQGIGYEGESSTNVAATVTAYYDAIERLLNDVGSYAEAAGLYQATTDCPWRPEVQDALHEYWGNSPSRLANRLKPRWQVCRNDVLDINILCSQVGAKPVTRIDVLIELLLSPKRRRAYRGYAKRRRDKSLVVSLYEFEQLYRQNQSRRAAKAQKSRE